MVSLAKRVLFPCLESVADYPHNWETDFCALKPGNNQFLLQETLAPSLAVRCGTFFGPSTHKGITPEGARTFYFLSNQVNGHFFRGVAVDRHELMSFGEDREIDTASNSLSIHCTISVAEDYLESLRDLRGTEVDIDASTKISLSPAQVIDLESAINSLTHLESNPLTTNTQEQLAHQESLAMALLKSLEAPTVSDVSTRNSFQLVNKALDYIRRHAHNQIRVTEVCVEIGTSVRTLEIYFRKHLNSTPKQAINQTRLSRLRRSLILDADPYATVAQISHAHGFTHLSQLAQDYFVAFRELPSQTLERTSTS